MSGGERDDRGGEAPDSSGRARAAVEDDGGHPFLDLANLLLRHRLAIAAFVLVTPIAVLGIAMTGSRPYRVSATVEVPGGGAERFTRLDVLRSVADSSFSPSAAGRSGRVSLPEALGVPGASVEDRRMRAAERLARMLSVSTTANGELVDLSLEVEKPALGREILRRLIEVVRTTADQTSRTKRRISTVRHEIDRLRDEWLAAQDSAQMESDPRYAARVGLLERVLADLMTLEVRWTVQTKAIPDQQLKVVSSPHSTGRESRRLVPRAIFGIALGGLFGLLWSYAAEVWSRIRREEPEEYRELVRRLRGDGG